MAVASRERHAARFGVETMVAGTAAVYDDVLRAPRRGRFGIWTNVRRP
jgi:hypothetical protein